MTRNPRATVLAILLAALAGLVDAAGFLHLHGFFVSFMSGNSTRLGVSLGQGAVPEIRAGVALIATFVVGSMLGAFIDHVAVARRRALVIAVETALLFGAALLHRAGQDQLSVGGMILAMGCENAVFVHEGRVSVGLTYMTGALVKIGQGIVAVLFGARPTIWLPDALLWLGLLAGAVSGTRLYGFAGLDALWVAAALGAGCAFWAFIDDRHLGDAA